MRKALAVLSCLCCVTLGACKKKETKPDLPSLFTDLRSDDAEKSGRARLELIAMGEPAVPGLVEMLRSGTPVDRANAADTLWGLGERAREAVPVLVETLADPDSELRLTAAMALENVGPGAAPAVPALIKAVGDKDRRVRQAAAKALGAIGPAAKDALPVLARAVQRQSWPVADEAIRKIRVIDEPSSVSPAPDTRSRGEAPGKAQDR